MALVFLPSLSSLSSRSFQRRTCSSLILKKRIRFCSSLKASNSSGSTHISSRIFASILSLFPRCKGWPESPAGSLSCGSSFSGVGWLHQSQVSFLLKNVGSGEVLIPDYSVLCQVLFLSVVKTFHTPSGWRHCVRWERERKRERQKEREIPQSNMFWLAEHKSHNMINKIHCKYSQRHNQQCQHMSARTNTHTHTRAHMCARAWAWTVNDWTLSWGNRPSWRAKTALVNMTFLH